VSAVYDTQCGSYVRIYHVTDNPVHAGDHSGKKVAAADS